MARRRLIVTSGTVALLMVAHADLAWAGPPPPPPSEFGGGGASAGGGSSAARISPPPPTGRLEAGSTAPSDPLSVDARTPDTDLTTNWTYSRSATVSGPNYVRDADDDPFFAVNPIGYYQGVSSSGGNLPPFAPKEVGGQSAVLTWTGFERTESSSRVFIQLSSLVTPEVTNEAGRVLVKLPRTSIKVRNNSRKLITKYFKTPVDEVKISRSGKDVLVTLALRWEVEPSWTFEPGANGYQVLVLEFPDQDAGIEDDVSNSDAPPAPSPPPAPTPPAPGGEGDEAPFLPTE